MQKIMMSAAALAMLGLASPAMADPERFELDPEHTTVGFTVMHLGYARTLGLFGTVEGTFTYDRDTQELSDVTVTIDTASVQTFNEARDGHVKSGDFLSAGDHPEITFTASGGEAQSETSGTVTGDLTLRGETRPVTLDVTLNKAGEYPFGHKRFVLGLSLSGEIMRSEWGMTYGVNGDIVGDAVQLIIETEGMRIDE
jgi:polyisoprenoid-binding protein YceI